FAARCQAACAAVHCPATARPATRRLRGGPAAHVRRRRRGAPPVPAARLATKPRRRPAACAACNAWGDRSPPAPRRSRPARRDGCVLSRNLWILRGFLPEDRAAPWAT